MPVTDSTKRALEVFTYLFKNTESFEEDPIGADLAYLMAAILNNTKCEWDVGRPIVTLLENGFPEPWIWEYIDVVPLA